MTYAETKLLLEYARLMMEIIVYSNTAEVARKQGYMLSPTDRLTVVRTSESKGFREHRDFVARLAPSTRKRYLAQVRQQLDAMREVFAKAKADGDPMSLDAFEITVRDAETGEAIGDLDPVIRAAEKQASRDVDAAALASGERSRAQLKAENGAFAFPRDRIRLEPSGFCPASGGGIPGAFVEGSALLVQCPSCKARWAAHDIPFRLPNHEPQTEGP
ncbi:MAG TPA: hypothetical protein VLN57_20985 [Xanthobacteraceae bacterium]|nr:hypothetical protein [Xanthobacteraceae bacterium]